MMCNQNRKCVTKSETPHLYPPDALRPDGQLPGQLSIDDILANTVDPADMGQATA